LTIHKVKKGDKIINQGDQGDVFYILEEGTAYASRVFNEKGKIIIYNIKMVHKE